MMPGPFSTALIASTPPAATATSGAARLGRIEQLVIDLTARLRRRRDRGRCAGEGLQALDAGEGVGGDARRLNRRRRLVDLVFEDQVVARGGFSQGVDRLRGLGPVALGEAGKGALAALGRTRRAGRVGAGRFSEADRLGAQRLGPELRPRRGDQPGFRERRLGGELFQPTGQGAGAVDAGGEGLGRFVCGRAQV
jgi:hypothetical protein